MSSAADADGHASVARLASRLARRVPQDTKPWPEARLAAVAAIMRVTDDLELLFIKRAEVPGDPWSGHIAFPGGRHAPADGSLERTAIRETQEELAVDLTRGQVLGRLDDLAPRSRALPPIIVRPFVAVVGSDVTLSPNAEVAQAFWVPVRTLCAPAAQAEHVVHVNGNAVRFPAFQIDTHVVWGLTERILRQLLSLLDR